MTLAFPDTGAERSSTPCAARIFRSSAEPSSEIDEHSTTMRGTPAFAFESSPFGPEITSSTSSQVEEVISGRSEEHTSELQSRPHLVCRLLLEKKNTTAAPLVATGPGESRM